MKTLTLTLFLLVGAFTQTSHAQDVYDANYDLSTCYYTVNPVIYGNPVSGRAEENVFKNTTDLINSRLCFFLLKWMVLPEDESYVGEFGTFRYQNIDDGYIRECDYEVVDIVDAEVHNLRQQVLNASFAASELISSIDQYEKALSKAVVMKCRSVSNRFY